MKFAGYLILAALAFAVYHIDVASKGSRHNATPPLVVSYAIMSDKLQFLLYVPDNLSSDQFRIYWDNAVGEGREWVIGKIDVRGGYHLLETTRGTESMAHLRSISVGALIRGQMGPTGNFPTHHVEAYKVPILGFDEVFEYAGEGTTYDEILKDLSRKRSWQKATGEARLPLPVTEKKEEVQVIEDVDREKTLEEKVVENQYLVRGLELVFHDRFGMETWRQKADVVITFPDLESFAEKYQVDVETVFLLDGVSVDSGRISVHAGEGKVVFNLKTWDELRGFGQFKINNTLGDNFQFHGVDEMVLVQDETDKSPRFLSVNESVTAISEMFEKKQYGGDIPGFGDVVLHLEEVDGDILRGVYAVDYPRVLINMPPVFKPWEMRVTEGEGRGSGIFEEGLNGAKLTFHGSKIKGTIHGREFELDKVLGKRSFARTPAVGEVFVQKGDSQTKFTFDSVDGDNFTGRCRNRQEIKEFTGIVRGEKWEIEIGENVFPIIRRGDFLDDSGTIFQLSSRAKFD